MTGHIAVAVDSILLKPLRVIRMSSNGLGSGSGGAGSANSGGDDDARPKTSPSNYMRPPNETKVVASKQTPLIYVSSKNQQGNLPHHQQQHLLLLNRQECSSNQSGSDSGLGYTNSISSENSSLIVNTTSLEQINAHGNSNSTNGGINNHDSGAIKYVNNERDRETQIAESDSFNIDAQNSTGSNNDSTISCIENGKSDAATTSIPNMATRTSDLGANIYGIEGQQQQQLRSNDKQLAKSVKVSKSTTISARTNQGNNLLSSALLTSRTKDEPGGQEAFLNINESSSENNARVINNIDDEAKIKQSTRRRAAQSANSTTKPREDDEEPDGTAEVSIDHEMRGTCTRSSGADQLSLNINLSASPHADTVPLIRSSLKKARDRSVDPSTKAKHNRNVSFNQTVIVFCEEIETSSPSETFEPPLDYQDTPINDEYQDLPGGIRGGLSRDFKSQNAYVNDDFDILSKIVGDDASSLTDDQLFGLLENGSLLKNFDLDEDDKALTIDRLNSDHSYLCHNAISDSESESSLTIDTRCKQAPAIRVKPMHPSAHYKEPTPNSFETNQAAGNQSLSKNDHEKSINYRINSQPADSSHESHHIEPILTAHQRSMPARVKVSTIDNNLKRQQKLTTTQLDEADLGVQTSSCPKVIHSIKQNTSKSEPMIVRLTNVEPAILSKSQLRDDLSANVTAKGQAPTRENDEDNVYSQTIATRPNFTSSSIITSDNQMSSRDNRLVDQHKQQPRDSSSSQQKASHVPNQTTSNVVNAQVIQTSQACHICRAIESNLHHNEFVARGERTSLMTNNGSTLHSNRTTTTTDQPQQQRIVRSHQYHGSSSATIGSQDQQKQLQLVPTSQSSCVSCRESIARQQHQNCITQPARPDLTNNLPDQQQARPIACQLVYVVDQCGNRMKALQVVGPAPMGLHNNQSVRPIMIATDNCRLPAPSAGQNWTRMSNPTGQVLGAVRSAPIQMNVKNPHTLNSDHGVQPAEVSSSALAQQQRMQIVNHSAPRNHTIYYVRQPLGAQDFRQSSSSTANSATRSFPDVHEIRRLDGIRAPTESPGLIQTINHANISPGQPGNAHVSQQFKLEDSKCVKLRRDDSDDPTFGFSRRPAVKVVTNAMRESQMQAIGKANQNFNQAAATPESHQRLLTGSLTLDRKSLNRDQSSQREVKENIPSTSSMSNINKTLTNYVGPTTNHRYESNSKPKGMKFGNWFSIKRP